MHQGPSPSIGILADDLTSAADGASPFVRQGLVSVIGRSHLPLSCRADVVAVDMATRSIPVTEAALTAGRIAVTMSGARILYKTVDSTLRGHVREEIGTVAKAVGRSRTVFAPAFPDAGRITRDGVQLVDGLPVDRSTYAADPVHPVWTSRLSDLLSSEVRGAIILDAETQDDLDRQVAAIPDPEDVLWLGSPGMAIALSRLVDPRPTVPVPRTATQEALVVVGSANAVGHAQADRAGGHVDITVLRAPEARMEDVRVVLADLTAQVVAALRTGRYGAVVATGGDTMEAILDALGITAFTLTGEVEPGFPTAVADHDGRPLALAMKAGGFGAPDALLRAARLLMSPQEADA